MDNFLISFNVVFPIFILMVIGFFLKSMKIFNDATVKQVNAAVFKVFLPASIFKNVYESEIAEVFNPKLIAFSVVCVLMTVIILFIMVPVFEKDNKKRGVLIQGIFRANFVIFGIPVSQALCGDAVSGSAAVLIAVVIPIFNFMAVIALEVFNRNKIDFVKILKGIITNPLIISSLLGLGVNFIGIKFPDVIETSIKNLASIATPLALIMLGASINLRAIRKNVCELLVGVLGKLVVLPGICLSLAAFWFKFRGPELAILISLFASPAAVSSFTMAQQMGGDDELAGQLVMFGTVASVVTMFLWIFTAMQLGLI